MSTVVSVPRCERIPVTLSKIKLSMIKCNYDSAPEASRPHVRVARGSGRCSDETGLDGFTTRALAAHLQVQQPASTGTSARRPNSRSAGERRA